MAVSKHIFLSYCSHESDFALRLAVDLKNAGINLWMDRLDIELGADWPRALQDGLNNSIAVLAVLSKGFVQSRYCSRELARADRLKLPVVPILLSAIAHQDWPIEIERRQYIDFVHWKTELVYHQQLARLVTHLREKFSSQIEVTHDPETQYLTSLVATVKSRNSLTLTNIVEERPEPFSTFEWNLDDGREVRRRTGAYFRVGALHEHRVSVTNQILQQFEESDRLIILGEPGTGKTSLLDYLCLKLVYERQMSPAEHPLPVLVRLADWRGDTSFDAFLRQSIPYAVDWDDTILLLDGLDELSHPRARRIDQVRASVNDPNRRVIVTCRKRPFAIEFKKIRILPSISVYDLNLRQVRVFLSAVFSEQRASQLLEQVPGQCLQPLLCNPRMLTVLAGINYRTPLENVGAALRTLAEMLVNYEQHKGIEDMLSYHALEYALAELAFEPDEVIDYERALHVAGAGEVLTSAERAGFLRVDSKTVRFAYPVFRSYFAAVWMQRNDLPWTAVQQRSDFDLVLLCLAGLMPAPDALITTFHDTHPELAMNCLVAGASAHTVRTVLSSWVRCSLSPDPKVLMQVPAAVEGLLNMMQEETWPVRQAAFDLLQALPVESQNGIIDLLGIRDDEREHAAIALKKIGLRALPTLLQYVQHANVELRRNVVWALDELADKACVPGLVRALSDDDVTVVSHAIQALGYLRDPASFPAVINMLGHPSEAVQLVTLETLHLIREYVVDDLVRALDHAQPQVRQLALRLLIDHPGELVTEILLKATYDASPDVRLGAVEALVDRETPATIARLAELAEEKDLHEAVIGVLRRFRSAAARLVLSEVEPGGIRQGSAVEARLRLEKALEANETPPPVSYSKEEAEQHNVLVGELLDRIQNGDWGEREEAAKALRNYAMTLHGTNVPHVLARLRPLLEAENWVLRWAVIEPLAWIGDASIVPDFIALLEDENWMVRVATLRGLQELDDPRTLEPIQTRLSDSNVLVREAALEALGLLGKPDVVPAIAGVLDDPDEMLRLAAVQALAELNHPAIVPSMIKALGDVDTHVRWTAVNGLRTVADTNTVPYLIDLLDDTVKPNWEDERICDIAASILERIGTQHARSAVVTWRRDQASANS